jgi:Spy/CpxP family protein refolding chaperone
MRVERGQIAGMFKPVYALILAALTLGSTQVLGASSQVLWLTACELEVHRDALTDVVDNALNDADATFEAHGPQDPNVLPNQQPPASTDKNRPYKWWLSEDGKKEFGISEQQSRELEALFQQMLPTLKANKTELDKQEKALDRLLTDGSSSETAVAQAIDRAEAARSALSRTRTLMLFRMYRLLTPEQRAKVQAYYERKAQEADGRTARR